MRQLADALETKNIRVWLDERELVPGRPWQEALEEIIQTTRTAAILFGLAGLGPWEEPEMRACLSEFVNRQLPVIPVLLPGAPAQPALPMFLRAFTLVDLRRGLTKDGLDRLVWGITGKCPPNPLFNRGAFRVGLPTRCASIGRHHERTSKIGHAPSGFRK